MAENGILDYQGMNQAIYRGATSNIVVDTQSMSIEIGAGNSSHTSNLHFECNHDANVASIKLNSNVVTEFSRSKKLIKYPRVALTSASQDGYVVTSYEGTTSGAENYNVFNGIKTGTDRWSPSGPAYTSGSWNNTQSNGTTQDVNGTIWTGEWLQIQLPNKIALKSHIIQSRSTHTHRMVKKGVILGSNTNGTTWNLVDSWSGLNSGSEREVSIDSINYYDYYRLVSIELETGNSDAVRTDIQEWELYGLPEYDPDAVGVDVKVTSYPNVPNTDWLEVYYDAKGLTGISSGVSDLSGNSINGVVTGATLSTDENIDIFNFDGQNDIIQGTFSGHTLSSGYTMATWIKPGVIGADDYIATFGVGSNGTSFGINFQTAEGAFRAFIWGVGTPGIVAQTNNGVVTKDKWVHIAATFISGDGTIHLYIDNKLTATGTGTALSSISASAPLVLGARNSGGTIERHANFKMANFRLFNRALTSDEIYQLYAYQKEYFGHGDLSMTLKAGRLGIGTLEPRAMLDVRGDIYRNGAPAFPIPVAAFYKLSASTSNTTHTENIQSGWVAFTGANTTTPGVIEAYTLSGGTTTQGTSSGVVVKLCKKGMYKLEAGFAINTQSGINSHIGIGIYPVSDSYIPGNTSRVHYTLGGRGSLAGYFYIPGDTNNINQQFRMTEILRVSEGPGYAYVTMTPNSNISTHFRFENWADYPHGVMYVTYLG